MIDLVKSQQLSYLATLFAQKTAAVTKAIKGQAPQEEIQTLQAELTSIYTEIKAVQEDMTSH